ncbi:hypothetical protein [Tropicimonas isoalkanivorans]|uniref:TspO and MBR related proteins n=1 Tax=Tropicimonas isoalkanivorans TaxID=441112 RepID=A0A1I1K9R7_9RHOB|nr:hypothetical protein [Tropicimonas isoalkanivorans]SFC57261.1 hypothetical protein SAMN04488094_106111 [Tropicimonas isoalkanivorans]
MSDLPDPRSESPGHMKSILVVTAAVAFAVITFSVPFSGFDPSVFPVPQADPPVQPAGYAFAIWGVIFLGLLAHALFGLVKRSDDTHWDAPRWPLIVSMVLGTPWTAVANFSPVWATILIFAMLVTALAALLSTLSRYDRWLLRAPLALYAGWLTVASFAGLAVVCAGYAIGPNATVWAWIALLAAGGLAIWVQLRLDGTPEYALAVAWGLLGVAAANIGRDWGLVALPVLLSLAVGVAWNVSRQSD